MKIEFHNYWKKGNRIAHFILISIQLHRHRAFNKKRYIMNLSLLNFNVTIKSKIHETN